MEPGGDGRCVTGGWRRGGVNAISRWRICGFWDLHYWDRIRIRYSQNHWVGLHLTIHFKMEKESNMSLEYILILYVKYCRCPSDQWRSACSFSAVCKTRHSPIPACGRALTTQWVCVCVSVHLHVLPCLLCVCKSVAVFICLFVKTLLSNYCMSFWLDNIIRYHHTLLSILIFHLSFFRLGGSYWQSWSYLLCGSCEPHHHMAETHWPTCSSGSDPLQLHTADGATQPQVR